MSPAPAFPSRSLDQPRWRGGERIGRLATTASACLAVATLPPGQVPLEWLLAFTAPAVLLGLLRGRAVRPWRRALLATALQVAACWLAFEAIGPMTRPAALACTILPPLAFVTTRHRDADGSLALFLSFCLVLVGSILGGVRLPLVAAFVATTAVALRTEAALTARGHARVLPAAMRRATGRLALSGFAVAVPCLLAALTVERTLGLLPSPSRERSSATGAGVGGDKRVGLGDTFVLGGEGGRLAELTGEQLVRVVGEDGVAVPPDLYLRSGFFDEPRLDAWQLGKLDTTSRSNDPLVLRRPRAGAPFVRFDLERYHGARNFVFVPPGCVELQGIGEVQIDGPREWLRQRLGAPMFPYVATWQPGSGDAHDRIDERWRRLGMCRVPTNLDRVRFQELLTTWQVAGSPQERMERIASGLARRCRYDRIEPTGPFAYAIENFLFATGDRRGYCMHFASAAALLLRLCDVPCRIGVGLYGGDADRSEPGARIFGSQHAHAWVEVPVQGEGWVVFDPTPAAERGQRMPSLPDPSSVRDDVRRNDRGREAFGLDDLVDIATQPWLLLLVLVLVVLRARWPADLATERTGGTPPVARNARRLLQRLLRALGELGFVRRRGETLEQFATRLTADPTLAPSVTAAFTAYQEVRFGGRPFDDTHERLLVAGLQASEQRRTAAGGDEAPRAAADGGQG